MKKLLIPLAVLTVAIVSFFGIRYLLNIPAVGSSVVMNVTFKGGMCPDGVCESEIRTIYSDGTYTYRGKINAKNMKLLQERIADLENDPRKPTEKPFCNSFFDGSDMIWIFPTIGSVTPCKIESEENKQIIEDITAILVSAK